MIMKASKKNCHYFSYWMLETQLHVSFQNFAIPCLPNDLILYFMTSCLMTVRNVRVADTGHVRDYLLPRSREVSSCTENLMSKSHNGKTSMEFSLYNSLSLCLFHLSVCLCVCPSVCLPISLSVHLCVCLFVCLQFACLSASLYEQTVEVLPYKITNGNNAGTVLGKIYFDISLLSLYVHFKLLNFI
jgi:hypothetical protein